MAAVRPILVHNFYRSGLVSGENTVVERELALLREGGLDPQTLFRHSDDLLKAGLGTRASTGFEMAGGRRKRRTLIDELRRIEGTLIHAHNVFPMITYEVFSAAKELGRSTIQTLHNYRLMATKNHIFGVHGAKRPGSIKERKHHHAMLSRVNPGRIDEWLYKRAIERAWVSGIVTSKIDAFLCLSNFQKRVLLEAGVPKEKVVVKPNVLCHSGMVGSGPGDFALFVGRLSAEKGVDALVTAWPSTGLPLRVIGEGPLSSSLASHANVSLLGRLPIERVLMEMAKARFLVMNSQWYEGFPLVLVEAFASGTPCLVPRLGSLEEIVANGDLGRSFAPGDLEDLAAKATELWDVAPSLRSACRASYERNHSPIRNLAMLRTIYDNIAHERSPGEGLETA